MASPAAPASRPLSRQVHAPAALRAYRYFRRNIERKGHYRAARIFRQWADLRPVMFRHRVYEAVELWLRSDDHNLEEDCYVWGGFANSVADLVRLVRRPGRVLYDIGANIGLYSLLAAAPECRPCQVYSFEPVSSTRNRLSEHVRLNGAIQDVRIVPFGVGDREMEAEILVPLADSGIASLHTPPADGSGPVSRETIQIRPLDQLAVELKLQPPHFMKVDVEGHELAAIRGAKETLAAHRPPLLIECNCATAAAAGWGFDELLDELRPLGYEFWDVARGAEGKIDSGSQIGGPNVWGADVLCLPETLRDDLLPLREFATRRRAE